MFSSSALSKTSSPSEHFLIPYTCFWSHDGGLKFSSTQPVFLCLHVGSPRLWVRGWVPVQGGPWLSPYICIYFHIQYLSFFFSLRDRSFKKFPLEVPHFWGLRMEKPINLSICFLFTFGFCIVYHTGIRHPFDWLNEMFWAFTLTACPEIDPASLIFLVW